MLVFGGDQARDWFSSQGDTAMLSPLAWATYAAARSAGQWSFEEDDYEAAASHILKSFEIW